MEPWFTWALLAAVFSALTTILAKVGLRGVDSDFGTLIRTAVILVLLLPFVILANKWRNPLTLPVSALGYLALSGAATGASWVCYFRALQLGQAAKVATVDKFSLVLIAILAVTLLGERPTVREWAGVALMASGVIILSLKS